MNKHFNLEQVIILTIFNMKARYRKTFAGFLWVILNPIIMYLAQAYIFKYVLKINVPNYFIFLLSGLLPWMFITQSLEMGVPIITAQGELLKSLAISPLTLVLVQILDNFINFFITFIILFIPFLFKLDISTTQLMLLPFSIILLLSTTTAATYFISIAQVFYRDIRFIFQFIINLMIFLTPIFYPIDRIPSSMRWLMYFNPFYITIKHIRIIFYNFEVQQYCFAFLHNLLFLIILLIFNFLLIKRKYNEIYLYL